MRNVINRVVLTTVFISLIIILQATPASAGVIFRDDFENQSSTWDIGDGPLDTPAGQEGYWSIWDRSTAAGMGCPDAGSLPSQSDGWLGFIAPNNGFGGGKAFEVTLRKGCSNGYPATLDYHFGANRREIYLGLYIKFEAGYAKSSFSAGCKVPYRFLLTGEAYNVFVQYSNGSFSTSNLKIYSPAFNGGDWWDTGITPADLYNDHDWHWLELRIKLNSSASSKDAEVHVWIDGVKKNSKLGDQFYTSGSGVYFDRIWMEQGNCSDTPWLQTDWRSVWFDNFTVSTSYIGPPGGVPPGEKPIIPAAPENLRIVNE